MFRFYYIVIISLFHEIYYLLRMNYIIRNKDSYSPEHRYAIVRNVVLFSVLVYELVGPALTKRSLMAVGEICPEGRTSARKHNNTK